jgi:hypothetical protein
MIEVAEERRVAYASFAFGETHLRFESDDSAWLSYLHRRYGSFSLSSTRDAFVVRFDPTPAPLPAALVSPLAPHLEAVDCEPTPAGFSVTTATTDCEIDFETGRAWLRGPSAMYPLDNVLRHLLPLLWKSGLIVHSALLSLGVSRSALACGPSGAGKSTIARLSRGRALSDELAAIRIENGQASAIALPFWEARPGSAPLGAVLHLRHGAAHRLSRLRPEDSLRRLASLVLWPVWDEAAMARSFAHLVELADWAPAYDLSFAPTEDVWDFVEEELS